MSALEIHEPLVDASPADDRTSFGAASVPATPRALQRTLTSMDFGEIEVAPPPTRRDRPVLVRMDSVEAGRVHTLDGPELRLGRLPDSGVVIDDSGISRTHARFYRAGDTYRIDDLGSSNGTYVNGIRVTSAEVAEGAVVQVGPRARFRFSVIDRHQERILRQLYEASVRDPLTGVFNRAHFTQRLETEFAYSNRHRTALSLIVLDIDHFKNVNDTHGHSAGDLVLKQFAATVFASIRAEDVLARYGGEEFVVLLRGISIQSAYRAAERLRLAVCGLVLDVDGKTVPVTVSIGGASTTCANVTDADSLISVADRRLYAAKKRGRNIVVTGD